MRVATLPGCSVLASAMLLSTASHGTAPDVQSRPAHVLIKDSTTCEQCRIVLERMFDLGASRDSVLLTDNTRFVVLGDGRILASPTATPGVIAVYNNRGALISTIGREGRGPGEFAVVWSATYKDDRLYAIDYGQQRINVFRPNLSFEREIALRENFMDNDGLLVIGSRIMVSSIYQNPATPASVVMLDLMGRRVRTISPEHDSVPMRARRRYLTESTGDKFWVAPFNRYVLELWDTAGRQHRTVTREAYWFRPWTTPTNVTTVLPQPQIKSIREDSLGRLWVSALVADSRWAPVPPRTRPEDLDANRLLDTRIELLNPSTGSLIATYLSDNALGKVIAPDVMFSAYRTDASGFVIWTLYRARLQGPRDPLP